MKILTLAILIILFYLRIKVTPSMLSEQLYKKRMQKSIDKNQQTFKDMDEEQQQFVKSFSILFTWLLEMFFCIFYIVLGTKLGTTYMMVLSALQVFTCIYTSIKQVNMTSFSSNIDDFPFYRWYFLFNVILDYIYYPMAIYMLLTK